MKRYYHLDSSGEDTNLQLYSLKQAKLLWTDLQKKIRNDDYISNVHERCVFIINVLGISISQLLGKNNPFPSAHVPTPKRIFRSLVQQHNLDIILIEEFDKFIDAYDSCRHFGLTTDDSKHIQVSKFTLEKNRNLYEFGLKIWDVVISVYRKGPQNNLEDLGLASTELEP